MKRLLSILLATVAAIAVGCSGSSNSLTGQGGQTGGTGAAVSSITVLTSSPTLPSDGSSPVDITALVRDANNNLVEGAFVAFVATSGGLTITQNTTDANGVATATLNNAGDPSLRTITVSAQVDNVTDATTVDVVGTTLNLTGPTSMVLGGMQTFTTTILDAGNNGVPGQTVAITSSLGNTLSSNSLTTDATGSAQFMLTANVGGTDTLTATALSLTTPLPVNISSDSFAFITPTPSIPPTPPPEVNLNVNQVLEVQWLQSAVPVADGSTVNFSTTRGTLTAASDTTLGGIATVGIQSANAGSATITASAPGGPTTTLDIEFVATMPNSIAVQASPTSIAPNEQSTITAVVRDPVNNLVKGVTVDFQLNDITGGLLSVGSAVTNSQGVAQTFYNSSSTTSAQDGVIVTATVQGTLISGMAALTVAQRELFISMGTGNEIFEPNSAQYRVEFAVQVTDAAGNGVAGVSVQLSILSEFYGKGFWLVGPMTWIYNRVITCVDEDVDRDGVLDAGEDFNGSGQLEAGNVATVTPGIFTTDSDGFGLVNVIYPQDHAFWVDVVLEARTSVQGTEFSEQSRFTLPISATDTDDINEAPPGVFSPYGVQASCLNLL